MHLKPDKSILLKLSVRSARSEFQIVGAAWQNTRLPKTVRAPASWSRQWSLERRWRAVMMFEIAVGRIDRYKLVNRWVSPELFWTTQGLCRERQLLHVPRYGFR